MARGLSAAHHLLLQLRLLDDPLAVVLGLGVLANVGLAAWSFQRLGVGRPQRVAGRLGELPEPLQ